VVATEETIKAFIAEAVKEGAEALTVGVAFFLNIGLKVREERKALQERRKLLEELARVRLRPGPTDDMSILTANFQQDDQRISEFVKLIEELTKRLRSGFA
jgi:hypothetical protein